MELSTLSLDLLCDVPMQRTVKFHFKYGQKQSKSEFSSVQLWLGEFFNE